MSKKKINIEVENVRGLLIKAANTLQEAKDKYINANLALSILKETYQKKGSWEDVLLKAMDMPTESGKEVGDDHIDLEMAFAAFVELVSLETNEKPETPAKLQEITGLTDKFLKEDNEIDLSTLLLYAKSETVKETTGGIKVKLSINGGKEIEVHTATTHNTKTGKRKLHEIKKEILEIAEQIDKYLGVEKLHKQPRSLLKTVAQRIGNTTDEPTLFTLPQKLNTEGGVIGDLKEEISKNTGALAFYLIQKYQENNSKPLEVTNLNSIAEVMNCNNYRLKLYLLYLGGYVYPIVDRDEKTEELVLTNEQLFKIEFRYSKEVADKYSVNKKGEIQGVERIGTNILNFIKDEPLDRVIITPNERFIKALEGKGLGNILTVNNKFIALILELTDIATKILSYSSSNRDSLKIGEDNLVKHLGLTKQIKKQGRPRVRATILKGLQELQEKEHIKSYSFDEETKMYSYTYSDKYVKYKQSKRGKTNPPKGVQ